MTTFRCHPAEPNFTFLTLLNVGAENAAAFTWLHDSLARGTEYWRALLGGVILLLVLLFPQGISGLGHYWQALAALKNRALGSAP